MQYSWWGFYPLNSTAGYYYICINLCLLFCWRGASDVTSEIAFLSIVSCGFFSKRKCKVTQINSLMGRIRNKWEKTTKRCYFDLNLINSFWNMFYLPISCSKKLDEGWFGDWYLSDISWYLLNFTWHRWNDLILRSFPRLELFHFHEVSCLCFFILLYE